MGQDKALLPFGGKPLALWMAERVRAACGAATLVGDRSKYAGLGLPVIEDICPGQGPLAGIHTALTHSDAALNLVLGCDMPYISPEFLGLLLQLAQEENWDAVVPESQSGGYEPLCAVYTPACLSAIEQALRNHRRMAHKVLEELRVRRVACEEWQPYDPNGNLFRNLNSREDYERACLELTASGRLLPA
ncbi:MAG: molybdenum cofactor guanylyltransferase [Acidobacteria bacterium]|nr:molybdenum cofactor guanylyltransferase [Acidobacteriota bacterium]